MNLLEKILNKNFRLNFEMSNLIIQFRNCKILFGDKIISEDLWIRNGKILNPEKVYFDEKKQSDIQLDCKGLTIVPGFIDTQINGGFGIDFTHEPDKIRDNVKIVSKNLLSHGVTAFCPTIVSSDKCVYEKVISEYKYLKEENKDGAIILGAHLEGPFISKDKFGAHDDKCLKTFKNGVKDLEETYGSIFDDVSIITLAPELDDKFEVTKYLVDKNVRVSIGHSAANLEIGEECMRNGASFITHLFNAMLPFHHRDPNIFGILSSKNLTHPIFYGIIADGIHTHPAALNIAYKTYPQGLVLVTDAISAMGLNEGVTHQIGNKKIEIQSKNRAVISGTETLCGSITSLNECIRIFKAAVNCSLSEAVKCASEHPAKLLGLYPKKGTLNYDADADFVLIDDDLNVYATFINGDLVFSKEDLNFNFKLKI